MNIGFIDQKPCYYLYLKSKLNGLLLTADFDPEAGLPDVGHGTDIKSSLEYGVHD